MHKPGLLLSRQAQDTCHTLGERSREPSLTSLDFADRFDRAADLICKLLLGQVKLLAKMPDPAPECLFAFHTPPTRKALVARLASDPVCSLDLWWVLMCCRGVYEY